MANCAHALKGDASRTAKGAELATCSQCLMQTGGAVKIGGIVAIAPASKKKKKQPVATKSSSTTSSSSHRRDDLWVCICCGNVSCGRNTTEQHALKHHQSMRAHAVAINLATLQCWCYECDEEIGAALSAAAVGGEAEAEDGMQKKALEKLEECRDVVARKLHALTSKGQLDANVVVVADEKKKNNDDDDDEDGDDDENGAKKKGPVWKGLSNLGNTCFFNSVMQNLVHLEDFRQVLRRERDELHQGEGGVRGKMTSCLIDFVMQMNNEGQGGGGGKTGRTLGGGQVVSPSVLFNALCANHIRFAGYQQQDSQEALRVIMDLVKTEETSRLLEGRKNVDSATSSSTSSVHPHSLHHHYRRKGITFVDHIFGARSESRVTCLECLGSSSLDETFFDISLPIPLALLPEREKSWMMTDLDPSTLRGSHRRGGALPQHNNKKTAITSSISKPGDKADDKNKHLSSKQQKKLAKQQKKEAIKQKRMNRTAKSRGNFGDDSDDEDSDEEVETKIETTENTSGEAEKEKTEQNQSENAKSEETSNENVEEIAEATSAASATVVETNVEAEKEEKQESEVPVSSETQDENAVAVGEENSEKLSKQQKLEAIRAELASTKPSPEECGGKLTLQACLASFFRPDLLDGEDRYACRYCNGDKKKNESGTDNESVKSSSSSSSNGASDDENDSDSDDDEKKKDKPVIRCRAIKSLRIRNLPPVLTIHIKRFMQTIKGLRKVSCHVAFPPVLDLRQYCSSEVGPAESTLYVLTGVVQHAGGMGGGHYDAYVSEKAVSHDTTDEQDNNNNNSQRRVWHYFSDSHGRGATLNDALNAEAYLLFYERIAPLSSSSSVSSSSADKAAATDSNNNNNSTAAAAVDIVANDEVPSANVTQLMAECSIAESKEEST